MEVYVVVRSNSEWEDLIIYTSLEEAIEKSKKWTKNSPVAD